MNDLISIFAAKPFLELGMSRTEAEVFGAQVRKDIHRPDIHGYMNYRIWMGQRPESG
jgi:hypothetical protein